MKKTYIIIVLCLAFFSFESNAQNQLSFSSEFNKETQFSAPAVSSIIKDSLVVPLGYVLKVEGSSILHKTSTLPSGEPFYVCFVPGSFPHSLTIDNYLIKRVTDPGIDFTPLWLGPGKHYIRFYLVNPNSNVNGLIIINGLLFKVDP
jgi:hypothetical protein